MKKDFDFEVGDILVFDPDMGIACAWDENSELFLIEFRGDMITIFDTQGGFHFDRASKIKIFHNGKILEIFIGTMKRMFKKV